NYTFKVQVSDGTLTDEEVITVTVKTVYTDNDITEPTSNEVNVLIDGKVVNAGIATYSERNGQTVITVAVDEIQLLQQLDKEGKKAVLTIPVATDSNVVIGELNGRLIGKLESQQTIIVLQTNKSSYTLPAEQIDISSVSAQFGA